MLDVHLPNHAPQGWRDFFIHIATISVGLLIAIGLEQAVEAIHHRSELHDLREQFLRDSERSVHDSTLTESAMLSSGNWITGRLKQVDEALLHDTPLPTLFEPRSTLFDAPTDPTWSAAKTTGRLALIPEEEMKAYSEADDVTSLLRAQVIDWVDAHQIVSQLQAEFIGSGNTQADSPTVTHGNLIEYQHALRTEYVAAISTKNLATSLRRSQGALLRGARTLTQVQEAEKQDDLPTGRVGPR